MRIGLAFDLKESIMSEQGCPEDMLEEYDSPETVDRISSILEDHGHEVYKLGGGKNFIRKIIDYPVDFVFNISEGLGNYRSREAQIPSILEMLNIPYTGSDPLCLAVSLDKPLTKRIVSSFGVTTPRWVVINNIRDIYNTDWGNFPFPAFIKPAHEGSSKGIRLFSRLENEDELIRSAPGLLETYEQPVLVEEYIDGDEITVGITGNSPPEIVGIMKVVPRQSTSDFIYSLEIKRDWENLVDYECPAQLDVETIKKISTFSLQIFKELNCHDFARIDFKVNRYGEPCFLEINPLAGLNPYSSDLPIMIGKLGQKYEDLIINILNAALERWKQCVRK
jgi:D-alanine-D-alanine ligase